MSKTYWDFDVINEVVPIEEVLAMHGIYPERGKVRLRENDDHPSAHVYTKTNTVHDFGYHNTFNPLSLTMYLRGCDVQEASRILGEAFHVPPKYTGQDMEENANRMMDYDWRQLGIHADLVTKNIDLDLEKYGIARTAKFSERFRMSMSELRDRVMGLGEKQQSGNGQAEKAGTVPADDWDRQWYERIMRRKAVPFVHEKRDEYFKTMYDDYHLAMAVADSYSMDDVFRLNKEKYEKMAQDLARTEGVLRKALDGTNVKFVFRSYYPANDFARVVNGEISFEIGSHTQAEVSDVAYRDKTKVFYCAVREHEYYQLCSNGMDEIMVAARQKGDQVSLAFSSVDAAKVNYLIKALRGKEVVLAESLGEALLASQKDKNVAKVEVGRSAPPKGVVARGEVSEENVRKDDEVGKRGGAVKT